MTGQHDFREPLHQPPDPLDLRSFPPATPRCASVRGRLRDFADGDLCEEERGEVEEHVHGCRTCAVALARAEHEVLRLRRAFGVVARVEAGTVPPLREDFAARVVQRLVLDETSLLSRDAIGKALASAPATPVGADVGRSEIAKGRSVGVAGFFVGAAVLLLVLVVGVGLRFGLDQQPERSARLTITQAADTYGDTGIVLERGDGLGEAQSLWVGLRGRALVDWHDATAKTQPAATLEVTNDAEVKVQHGEPLLMKGTMQVETRRPITIPVGDGSRIDLGVGEYLISADVLNGLNRNQRNPLAGAPAELRVGVEVLRGDGAQVLRETRGPTLIAEGHVGTYEGDSPIDVRPGSNVGASVDPGRGSGRQDPVEEPVQPSVLLRGKVLERSGVGAFRANVHLSYASGGVLRSGMVVTGVDGSFELPTGAVGSGLACDSPFAILTVLPPANRELGVTVPEAFRLGYGEGNATVLPSPVLDASMPLSGTVRDDFGMPRSGVRVVPCVVDELFPCVLVMPHGQVVTGSNGDFRLPGLPVWLPHHQHLAVMLVHADLEPTVVRVAPRSSIAARLAAGSFVAGRLRSIRLKGLPASSTVQLLEDVKGVPAGSAMIRRVVSTDARGEVAQLQVGSGGLWVRHEHPASPMVRMLGLVGLEAVPLYEQVGPFRPLHTEFQAVEALTGSEVCVDNSFRFEVFATKAAGGPVQGSVLTVYDSLSSRTIAGSQVFAVGPGGPRGAARPRFLGFTSSAGQLGFDLLEGETGIVTVGPDGSLGVVSPGLAGGQVAVALQENGRVLLDESLRPPSSSGQQSVPILLERTDSWVPGLSPVLVRFASASEGWIVGSIPPGEYRATVDGVHRSLTVTNGLVVLY